MRSPDRLRPFLTGGLKPTGATTPMMMRKTLSWLVRAVFSLSIHAAGLAQADDSPSSNDFHGCAQPAPCSHTAAKSPSDWHYGAYLDAGYLVNFNFPPDHKWRSRATTEHTNEGTLNMGLLYIRKDLTAASRWGTELGFQNGNDTKHFAFLIGEPTVAGADTLRHIQSANVAYLAPVGQGLTITAGLFKSVIGYESLYAKDNVNYTRSWAADNSPYMMFGVNATYSATEKVTVSAFIINGYYHLSNPNDQPSYGSQIAWKPAPRVAMTSTLYYGPDQNSTALEYWRLFSNHVIAWRGDEVTIALTYDIGTERMLTQAGHPRTFAMAGVLYTKWHIAGPWSMALRPEFYWDRNGRWTGSQQFVRAITATAEYQWPYAGANTVVRLEYRHDTSTGAQGGFTTRQQRSAEAAGLRPDQDLLLLGVLWTFDS